MTAVNAVLKPDRVIIMTDGATYDRAGVLHDIREKCDTLPGLNVAVATSGALLLQEDMTLLLPRKFRDIDDIASNGEAFFRAYYDARSEVLEEMDLPGALIVIAGWSPKADLPVLLRFHHDGQASFHVCPKSCWAPNTPGLVAIDPARFDARTDGLKMMEAQRWDSDGGFLVGGHVMLTEVSRAGIKSEIIHRWEEDRVSEKIDPARSAGVVVPLVRLSRHERRRLEKLGRRAVA